MELHDSPPQAQCSSALKTVNFILSHSLRSPLWRAEGSPPDAWFDWYRGNVYTTNPDCAVLAKALRIAAFLDAHVEGDDGKIYCGAEDWAELPA